MNSDVLKSFAKRLSDDDLSYLRIRFKQNLCGDLSEIANFLAKDAEVDAILKETSNAEEWFQMIDYIGDVIEKEYNHRETAAVKS